MKIAISSDGPDLDARVSARFGTSPYMIILDLDTMNFEAIENPGASGGAGAGVKAIVIAVTKEVQAVLTGQCNPMAERHLNASGINVFGNQTGTVRDAIEVFRKGAEVEGPISPHKSMISGAVVSGAFKSSGKQFASLFPMLVGVVLLIGLFNALVTKDALASVFSGNTALDTIWGACFGSIFAGNPINSYVIGGELLDYDVSLYAVTALIVAWVTVGIVQLPAEIAALGRKFALLRNALSFVVAIPIAIVTVAVVNLIEG